MNLILAAFQRKDTFQTEMSFESLQSELSPVKQITLRYWGAEIIIIISRTVCYFSFSNSDDMDHFLKISSCL